VIRTFFHAIAALALLQLCADRALAQKSRPGDDGRYELLTPRGAGPFPAVVVLHGCNGIGPNIRTWAHRLVGWGYAALIVDSFRRRGLTNICNGGGNALPALARAQDAMDAKAYLQTLPNIARDRIAVIGFSHGGATALAAAYDFAATIAYYPWCPLGQPPSNALVLIGGADDWVASDRCLGGANVKIYPGATHAFDSPGDRTYLGHHLAYNPAAAADSQTRTHQFLVSHLGR
jgi:dienelactone hydrolase